jgi:predicted permease
VKKLRVLWARLRGSFAGQRRERELAEELECHLQMRIDDNLRAGMSLDDARRAALLESGGIESSKEACRDRRGLPALDAVMRDARHTLRLLRRSPVFTFVAVLSLALGIGANTAIFTLLDQAVLRRLPVRDPEQLLMIWTSGPSLGSNQGSRASSYPMYQDFQRQASTLSHVFCRYITPVSITVGGQSDRVIGELVSGNYFQALGVGAELGRVFSPEADDREYKGHPVVVLSHRYWATRFASDRGVLGRTILVNNYPMAVVGVSEEGFSGIDPVLSPQIRIPVQMKPVVTPASDNLGDRRRQWVQVFARRKPGATSESAQASLQQVLTGVLRGEIQSPALRHVSDRDRVRFLARKVVMESAAHGYSALPTSYSNALAVLMGLVGVVLLIACFNVASLLFARAAARRKEFAMRLALGASRGQLLRQLLLESVALAAAGGAAGVLLSVATVSGLLHFLPTNGMLTALRAEPDWRVLTFSATLVMVAALLFGLAPAWQALKVDLWGALKEAAGAAGGGRGSARIRKALVTGQLAFSYLLVAAALLFATTLLNLRKTTAAFREIDRVLTFQVNPAASGYSLPRLTAFCQRALEQVRAVPGVTSAGYAWVPVLSGREADWDVIVEGRQADGRGTQAYVNGISPGYWGTMGVPLLEGRDFGDGDVAGRPKVAIVSRAFATHAFGEQSPIGRRIGLDTGPTGRPDVEIVGVVEDSLYEGPRQGVRRQVFFPFSQLNQSVGATFYVRTTTDANTVFAALRGVIRKLDTSVPLYEVKTLETQLDETLGTERLTSTLSAAFGLLATLLAAIGLYGVMTLTVARRTREIGLRMAVGASRGEVVWMVMKEALGLCGVGLAIGIPAAWAGSRFVGAHLFGTAPADPWSAAGATVVLVAATAVSGFLPARRASTIDPIQALRQE